MKNSTKKIIANQPTLLNNLDQYAKVTDSNDNDVPDTYKGRYAMHKYWSKKPHSVVANYIQRFTKESDVVLDSFCGSGVTVIESVRLKRRAIGIDINPIATLSTRVGLERIDTKSLQSHFHKLKVETEKTFSNLYETSCPICNNPNAITTHVIWQDDQLSQIWFSCNACNTTKGVKSPTQDDINNALNPSLESTFTPKHEMFENYRISTKLWMSVADLFTPRALSALSYLLNKIRQIDDPKVRMALEFCFSATLPQSSNMVFVIRNRGKANGNSSNRIEVGSWVIGYWLPSEHFEINAWRCFENRFKRILKGFQEINAVIPQDAHECLSFEELFSSTSGYLIQNGNASQLSIPNESIDYVFIDPPHGNRIPYLELSLIWNSWLGFDADWDNEIVISEAKSRGKNITDYKKRLEHAFDEIWRVLKPNHYMSLVFNSLDDDTWLSIINACLHTGFEVESIEPLKYSASSVVQDNRKNALKTDFVINAHKTMPRRCGSISFSQSKEEISGLVRKYLSTRENGAETYELLNFLVVNSIPHGVMFRVSNVLDVLEHSFNHKDGRWL